MFFPHLPLSLWCNSPLKDRMMLRTRLLSLDKSVSPYRVDKKTDLGPNHPYGRLIIIDNIGSHQYHQSVVFFSLHVIEIKEIIKHWR